MDQIILNNIALCFGLQYKPSSGAEEFFFFHSAPEEGLYCKPPPDMSKYTSHPQKKGF